MPTPTEAEKYLTPPKRFSRKLPDNPDAPKQVEDWNEPDITLQEYQQQRMIRHWLLASPHNFSRFAFKLGTGLKLKQHFTWSQICSAFQRVLSGEITRLLINCPPSTGKTEAICAFLAQGIALNPRARAIAITYSHQLAEATARRTRDIIITERFQTFFPGKIRQDANRLSDWRLEGRGGGLQSRALGGQLTGLHAGLMDRTCYTGALILDDPMKAGDAFSKARREAVKTLYANTLPSRLTHQRVPIIIVGQRLHEEDLFGFLLTGGTGEQWHHLRIPALLEKGFDPLASYPDKWKYGEPIGYEPIVGSVWGERMSEADLRIIADASPAVFAAQQQQAPLSITADVIKPEWLQTYEPDELPELDYRFMVADTANSAKASADFSVIQLWGAGKGTKGRAFLLAQIRGRWDAPELYSQLAAFWQENTTSNPAPLRAVYVEAASTGAGLIAYARQGGIPAQPLNPTRDKYQRVCDVAPRMAQGEMLLPASAPWLNSLKAELLSFTPDNSHAHDDMVDCVAYALKIIFLDRSGSPKLLAL